MRKPLGIFRIAGYGDQRHYGRVAVVVATSATMAREHAREEAWQRGHGDPGFWIRKVPPRGPLCHVAICLRVGITTPLGGAINGEILRLDAKPLPRKRAYGKT